MEVPLYNISRMVIYIFRNGAQDIIKTLRQDNMETLKKIAAKLNQIVLLLCATGVF